MTSQPLITFHVNSYNRLSLVRNLLQSFTLCNQYPNVEWVISDYGSTDGSREYLQQFAQKANFPVHLILGDEQVYFEAIRAHGVAIDSRWAKFRAILGHFRNEVRAAARGDYYFDVADDHQFIRQGNWVPELLDILEHRLTQVGHDDVSGIVPYGYVRWRLDKANNAREVEANSQRNPYYVAKTKNYVDYSFMPKSTYTKVGKYLEPTDLQPGTEAWDMWANQNDWIQPETEYEGRCTKLGLKRIFMKYPITVSFPNDILTKVTPQAGQLVAPLWSLEKMKQQFGRLDRPVSSDELLATTWAAKLRQSVHNWTGV